METEITPGRGLAIQASGARGQDIGALVAEFGKRGPTTEKDVPRGLDTLVGQGKAGAFTLQHLATEGEKTVPAHARMGFQGLAAVAEPGPTGR